MFKLSVICCAYNAEKYLQDSLDSVHEQIFCDYELILVNDGSTDSTGNILHKYAKENKNVKFYNNQNNMGVPYSRNFAISQSSGEYIAIHDADDISLFNRFEKEVLFLEKNSTIDIVGSHAIKISNSGKVLGTMVYPPENTDTAFKYITRFRLNPIIDPSSMFRKKVFLDIGGYRMDPFYRTVQDFDLWCRLLLKGHLLYNFQEPLIKYRINPDGVTNAKSTEMTVATDEVWALFQNRKQAIVHLELFGTELLQRIV